MAQELKARGVDDVYIEYYNTGKHELAQVYLKSEADNVITELKEKLKVQTSIAEEGWKEFRTYHTSYAEAVKELYDKNKEIAELKEEQRWRKFSEEKPNDKQVVLVYGKEWFETAIYHNNGTIDFGDDIHFSNITETPYWRPLPKAPEDA